MDMNDARDAFQTMVRRVNDTLGKGRCCFVCPTLTTTSASGFA